MAEFARAKEETAAPVVTPAEALEPTDNQAAVAQSAELTGQTPQTDPQKAQADEAKETEREAAARKGWEALLGEKLGGEAFNLIREHVSFADLQGYAKQGTSALADLAKTPFSAGGSLSADDAGALNALASAFAPELQKLADAWLTSDAGQRLFTAISQWVEGHPGTVTAIAASLAALAIGAGVVAIISDADPPAIKQMFEVAKGLKVGGSLDLESIKSFAVKSAELSMNYSAGGFSARLAAATKRNDAGDQVTTVGGGVGYKGEGFEAGADAQWSSEGGLSGGAKVEGKGGNDKFSGQYLAEIRVDEEGRTQVTFNGGLDAVLAGMPAELRAGLTHAAGGGQDDATQIEASMQLGEAGNQQTVKGSIDPKSGAFTLTFERTAYDGAAKISQGFTGDGAGGVQSTRSFTYQAGDDLSLKAGETTSADGSVNRSLGMDFTTGAFKNSFDLEMKDAVTRLSLGTEGKVGNFSLGGDARLNIDDGRLEQLGVNLGWRDPNAFKSATLRYKLDWQQANGDYAHHFDAAFEHAAGKWEGRLSGNLDLQGGDVTKAGADALVGYRLADRWRLLGGASIGTSNQGGQSSTSTGVRAGVQFDNVAVTFGVDKTLGGGTTTGFRIEIPLGRR